MKVAGSAMEPNYHDGQTIQTEDVDPSELKRGDVIIFDRDGNDIMFRLIGLPGETVAIHDGEVFINSVVLDEPYDVIAPTYTFDEILLDDNEYFVLGDNRDESTDSHVEGPISGESIKKRVTS